MNTALRTTCLHQGHTVMMLAVLSCLAWGCTKHRETNSPFIASFTATINKAAFSCVQSAGYRLTGGVSFMDHLNGTDSAGLSLESSLLKTRFVPDTSRQNTVAVFVISHIPDDSLSPGAVVPVPEHTFRRILSVGKYGYTYMPSVKGGIIVAWYDANGKKWATGIDDQADTIPGRLPDYTRNYFTVTFSQSVTVVPGTYIYRQEVHMTFNCWVYDGGGDSLHIENAKFNTIFSY